MNCRVTDNGSGLGRIKPGRGLRIVRELAKSLGGRMDHTFGTTSTSFVLDFPLTQREQHANRAVVARRPRTGRRLKAMPARGLSAASRGRASKSPRRCSPTSRPEGYMTMSRKTFLDPVRERVARRRRRRAHAALAQFGPPPGPPPAFAGPPPASVPVVLLRVSAPVVLPSVVLRPDLSLAFRPVAPRAHLRATSPVVRLVSMVLPDCVVSIAAARPIFAASRVAPRPTAPTLHPQWLHQPWLRPWLPVLALCGAAAAYAYGGSYASSDDGCYYVSTYRRYGTRRVLVCHGN